jgi:hypothetical protein
MCLHETCFLKTGIFLPGAGGYVCGEGFLNGQLTVTRGLGDFHPDMLSMQRQKERLKYRLSDKEPLELTGPLISGKHSASYWMQWPSHRLDLQVDMLRPCWS